MDLEFKQLDDDEILQLAIHASGQDRHDLAITYLKEAVKRNPENANAINFLAVEHAQIGLYPRAMEEMQRAIELNPDLHTARLQLGLLYLTSAMAEPSLTTLQPLTELNEDNYFCCFAKGLQHLIRDEFADCKQWLEKGIKINDNNLALNRDMQRLLDAIKNQVTMPIESAPPSKESEGGNLWLSAYQSGDEQNSH